MGPGSRTYLGSTHPAVSRLCTSGYGSVLLLLLESAEHMKIKPLLSVAPDS
jgi:hypothetical protein